MTDEYTIQSGEYGGYAVFHNGNLVDTYETEAEAQEYIDRINPARRRRSQFEWLNS